ncbi:FadR/GntR family transcriptional regulator [Ruegeria marina]|uniref:DNA-binding transcriptional regulator, FadR family n=1 Tax=Ruegeria marina TaxID=639004 RepID=A0A1G6TF73_9RHOB|nr:FadR/GntR family transcriptional regulator [Ruegeria marina]SDD27711.1 DNA-binding transcriptional regulator, FadR family [Ruegeria marina]
MAKGKSALKEAVGFPPDRSKATLNRTSYADQAYAYLFHQITIGAYGEGEQLPSENELCELFGISRPVVRKALERLREDDLIDSRRGSGSFVKRRKKLANEGGFTDGRLREILMNLEFRKVIEPAAAYFAAQRRSDADLAMIKAAVDDFEAYSVKGGKVGRHLDFKFHHAVATASGNRRFVDAISAVEYDVDNAVNLVRYLARFDHLERAKKVWSEHLGMYQAIESQNAELARKLMTEHLEQARIRMMEHRP